MGKTRKTRIVKIANFTEWRLVWICWATVSMWAALVTGTDQRTWINDGKFGHFEVTGHVDRRLCVCGSECKRHRATHEFFIHNKV